MQVLDTLTAKPFKKTVEGRTLDCVHPNGGVEEVLTTRTVTTENATVPSSYLVTQTRLAPGGVNCTQWFSAAEFQKRFKVLSP